MKIQWNKVTWYSKLIAVILFVATFGLGIYIGSQIPRNDIPIVAPQAILNPKIAGRWSWSETLGDGAKSSMKMTVVIKGNTISGTYDAIYNNGDKLDGCTYSGIPDCGIQGSGANNLAQITFLDAYEEVNVPATITYDLNTDSITWDIKETSLPKNQNIYVPHHAIFSRDKSSK